MGQMIYNINDTATQVLAAKKTKENIFMGLLHRNGYGVTQQEEVNATTIRMFKVTPFTGDARKLGSNPNGQFFNKNGASIQQVTEYDLNLDYIYDDSVDIPEVQQDLVPVNLFDNATKNTGDRVATEINASTIAHQLAPKFNAAKTAASWDDQAVTLGTEAGAAYAALLEAGTLLDDGDEEHGIQAFPFEARQVYMRPRFRKELMGANGVLIGGSNYAQSMLAKGVISPEARKEFGTMYVGEIDGVPAYTVPSGIWNRAGVWVGDEDAFSAVQAVMCAASATDRGIATQDYIKVIDSPDGAGKRLQPKTRWGINVCYPKGIVPIIANGAEVPASDLTITAPGSKA